jgi:hypothetical protein
MDVEQLKLILDVVRDAGVGAWWIALIWIAKPYFAIAVWAGVVVTVSHKLFGTIRTGLFTETVASLHKKSMKLLEKP